MRVQVSDLDIPFGSLVVLLTRIALASIPALLIVGGVLFVAALAILTTLNEIARLVGFGS